MERWSQEVLENTWILNPCFMTKGWHAEDYLQERIVERAPSPSCFPRGKFPHLLACTGILRPVTPHRLAFCPPLGQIVIFIYQLITTLPALSPPSQETNVKRMKTGRQFHPSAPPSRTLLAGSLLDSWKDRLPHPISTHQRLDVTSY